MAADQDINTINSQPDQTAAPAPAPAPSATPPADAAATTAQVIQLDGSSTVYPISEAVAEEFQIQNQGKLKVTVGVSGTGGGFKKFCRGELDIASASRPISAGTSVRFSSSITEWPPVPMV